MNDDPKYFETYGIKLPIQTYKDFKTLHLKKIVLTNECPHKENMDNTSKNVYVALCGEWDADPEHGVSFVFHNSSLSNIAGFSDV